MDLRHLHLRHDAEKCLKVAGKGQSLKNFRQSTQLAERSKTSTISWGFGGFPMAEWLKQTIWITPPPPQIP